MKRCGCGRNETFGRKLLGGGMAAVARWRKLPQRSRICFGSLHCPLVMSTPVPLSLVADVFELLSILIGEPGPGGRRHLRFTFGLINVAHESELVILKRLLDFRTAVHDE